MVEADIDPFREELLAMFETLSQGRIAPTDRQVAMWFRLLGQYPLPAVRAGFEAFMREPGTGRTLPVPADVIAKLEGSAADDGRPGAEEAWAIALSSADERETVVWTREIAQAWGVARVVLEGGDEVGARMAFREAYGRIVGEARAQRLPMEWTLSLGHDSHRRAAALQQAAELGRAAAGPLIAAPNRDAQPLLTLALSDGIPQEARAKLLALRDRLTAAANEPSLDAQAKAHTAQRKDEAARLVAEYESRRSS